jgi:hypothetical protein
VLGTRNTRERVRSTGRRIELSELSCGARKRPIAWRAFPTVDAARAVRWLAASAH